jgi:hypothetical protein
MVHWALQPGRASLEGPCPHSAVGGCAPRCRAVRAPPGGRGCTGAGTAGGERADIVCSSRGPCQRTIFVSAVARAASTYPRHVPRGHGVGGPSGRDDTPGARAKTGKPRGVPKESTNLAQWNYGFSTTETVIYRNQTAYSFSSGCGSIS